jgi:lipopolysaccharide cholinephosphotransferase
MTNKIFSINKKEYKTIIYFFGIKIRIKTAQQRIKKAKKDASKFRNMLDALCPPSQLPQARGELRDGQVMSIKLLKDFKKICEANNITYWIDLGTLLGAYRHKGYIPWDSDIDTCMPRQDFDKVIPLLKEYYKNSDIVVREYGFTNHFQVRLHPKASITYGVDIFPVDEYYKPNLDDKGLENLSKKIKTATKELKKRCKSSKLLQENSMLFRQEIDKITKKYIQNGNEIKTDTPAMFFAIDYPIPYKNLARNYDDIFPLGQIEFEGETFACPKNVEKCLISLYDENYMHYPEKFKSGEDKIDLYINGMKGFKNND